MKKLFHNEIKGNPVITTPLKQKGSHAYYFVVTGCTWGGHQTTSSAASDYKVVSMTTFSFQSHSLPIRMRHRDSFVHSKSALGSTFITVCRMHCHFMLKKKHAIGFRYIIQYPCKHSLRKSINKQSSNIIKSTKQCAYILWYIVRENPHQLLWDGLSTEPLLLKYRVLYGSAISGETYCSISLRLMTNCMQPVGQDEYWQVINGEAI